MKNIILILLVSLFGVKHIFAGKIKNLYAKKQSDVQVLGEGKVIRILEDDNIGSRHQRFIVRLNSGLSVMIAHNIDIAPRIDTLRVGDTVKFNGEYEYNLKGGIIHWTHHDPNNYHKNGWVKHKGKLYQ